MATKIEGHKKIKCKFCESLFINPDVYVRHLESEHDDMIPEDMSPWQFFYFLKTGRTAGICRMCKKPTEWNEATHKYKVFCNNPRCRELYRKEFEKRMIGKYGKTSLLDDPEQQRKMLANRSISGVYTWWDDKTEIPYTGSYELEFLKFLSMDLEFPPDDIIAPSPHTYYYIYEGKKHFYIPDFFIPSLNLEVEIKDGGDNPNTHHKIQDIDKVKEMLKDDVMKSVNSIFNYIKIENKDHVKFLRYLEIAKVKFQNGETDKIFMP